jgi:hypothetical protein
LLAANFAKGVSLLAKDCAKEASLLPADCTKDESQLVDSYCNCAKGASLVGRRLYQGCEPAC